MLGHGTHGVRVTFCFDALSVDDGPNLKGAHRRRTDTSLRAGAEGREIVVKPSAKDRHQYDGFCGVASCAVCFNKWLALRNPRWGLDLAKLRSSS